MILSMTGQAWLFLMASALGFTAGLMYDLFRILRKTFKHPDFLTYFEDMLFWLGVTALIFYFMLNKNDGEIRIFSIIGVFLGMVVYFCSLSIVVRGLSVAIINFVKKVVGLVIKIILAPIKLILKIISVPLKWLAGLITPIAGKAKTSAKKGLKKTARYARIKSKGIKRDFKIMLKKI